MGKTPAFRQALIDKLEAHVAARALSHRTRKLLSCPVLLAPSKSMLIATHKVVNIYDVKLGAQRQELFFLPAPGAFILEDTAAIL